MAKQTRKTSRKRTSKITLNPGGYTPEHVEDLIANAKALTVNDLTDEAVSDDVRLIREAYQISRAFGDRFIVALRQNWYRSAYNAALDDACTTLNHERLA